MAEELFAKGKYYDCINHKFVDPHKSCMCALEAVFSQLLFDHDLSRIIYSAPDIAFRRRIELLDTEQADQNMQFTAETLELPFASYYRTGDPQEDDRPATKNIAMAVIGSYVESISQRIRFVSTKTNYEMIVYLNNMEDTRKAHQLLFWEAFPIHELKSFVDVRFGKTTLRLPVFFTIKEIDANPAYNEKEWLEKMRIFPIKVSFEVRSFQLLINNIKGAYPLPIRFANHGSLLDEAYDDNIYYTEKVLLDFLAEKWDVNTNPTMVNADDEEVDLNVKAAWKNLTPTEEEYYRTLSEVPSEWSVGLLEGYFNPTKLVNLNQYKYNDAKTIIKDTGEVVAWIDFSIRPADVSRFNYLEVLCPGHEPVYVRDCKAKYFTIDKLYQNSKYDLKILVYTTTGENKLYSYSFTTKQNETNLSPTETTINVEDKKDAKIPGLLGMEW